MDLNKYDHVLFAIHRKAAYKLVVRTRIHSRMFPTGMIKLVGDGLSQSMSLID
ncbi:hypothetical protein [Candidatus Nitrospira neomarina]|uniref:Uncharacterized protein n=1 Tax=Candidatus Nitrospira neomarina TaxID=3020899 RepID=A0AA96K1N9_9BACT|nr:hypothetical protein [Candidatus Nitrospira neomarina]WNM63286.1 hypothetical protein PQG83_05900 [Candidatus Nitrospira neomarina]